jgi:hypothetical protein
LAVDSRFDPASPSTALYATTASARDDRRQSQPRSPSLAHSLVIPKRDACRLGKTNDLEAANRTAGHQEPQGLERPNVTLRPVPPGAVLISRPGLTQDYVE